MPSSSVTKQAEKVLEDVLRTLQQDLDNPNSVLCETDRKTFVKEEESLSERLKEIVESEPNWRALLRQPSPQAAKCLKDAEELLERVKEDIHAKVRTRLMGESNPPSSSQGQGLAVGSMGVRTPETDIGLPPADGNLEPASMIVTSPLNMRCSLPELSELNINPAVVQEDNHYRSDLHEAINTPLEMSSDRSSNSSSRRQRRSPPPPPSPRRIAQSNLLSENTDDLGTSPPRGSQPSRRSTPPPPQSRISRSSINASPNHLLPEPAGSTGSGSPHRSHSVRRPAPPPPQIRTPRSLIDTSPSPSNSHLISETTDSSGSSSPRRSHSLRRPAPSPPQSRTPRASIHTSLPSPHPLPFDPALFSSISELTQHVNSLASSMVTEGLSMQAHGRRGQRRSDGFVTKTNCVDINGSNVDGLTLNNGGSNNSGAVIHKTVLPQRSPQPISHF